VIQRDRPAQPNEVRFNERCPERYGVVSAVQARVCSMNDGGDLRGAQRSAAAKVAQRPEVQPFSVGNLERLG